MDKTESKRKNDEPQEEASLLWLLFGPTVACFVIFAVTTIIQVI